MSFESALSIELKKEREKCVELMRINFDLTTKLRGAEARNIELENKLNKVLQERGG